jgi:CubicO group peptidase (beta-lactamase class C family)
VGAAASLAAGPAAAVPFEGLLQDGPDGTLSAGLITRSGDGRIRLATSLGRRMTGPSAVVRPFGLDDPFRVASVSKMIATVGFMQLVEKGLVRLEDDASDHLGFRLRHPAFPGAPITIRQLLSHTSSLRNGPSYPIPAGHRLEEAFRADGRHFDNGAWFGPADRPPGAWFAYADVNFCLIAQIMERLTGSRFDRYMQARVLAPLGLDAGYNWTGVSQAKRDRAASARRWLDGNWKAQVDADPPAAPHPFYSQPKDGPPVPEVGLKLGENGFLFSPQGGLRVSLRDMDVLAAMFRRHGSLNGQRIIKPHSLQLMQTPVWRYNPASPNGETGEAGSDAGVFGGYGLGMEIPQNAAATGGDAFFRFGSRDWRGHLGDAYGWLTGLFWNIRDGRTLVWAVNGVRETDRPRGRRSALSPQEEQLIDLALRVNPKAYNR